MLFWTLQTTVISIILIFLVHNLFSFFKSTLTVPKIKDLVNSPAQKYENMFNVLSNTSAHNQEDYITKNEYDEYDKDENNEQIASSINLQNYKPNINSMKNELKSFLKTKLNNKTEESIGVTDISSLDTNSNSLNYSAF